MARWAPARADVVDELAREILQAFPRGRILVGIDGLDGAGKTTFARDLSAAFERTGVPSAVVSMDDFLQPLPVRHAAPDDADHWYRHAFDLGLFRRQVIEPYRRGESVALQARRPSDGVPIEHPDRFDAGVRAVLVVEGIFLHRPDLVGLWHSSVWLEVPTETAFARCVARDGWEPAPEAPLRRRFFAAQDIYLREVDPRRRTMATVDLTDPEHPRRVFSDSC